jgi:hypothetical protein
MNTPQTPLDTRRQVLAMVDRLDSAKRAVEPAHGYASRMIDFEQEQLLAELAQLTDGGEFEMDVAAESSAVDKEPWSFKAALASIVEGFVSALKTRTA